MNDFTAPQTQINHAARDCVIPLPEGVASIKGLQKHLELCSGEAFGQGCLRPIGNPSPDNSRILKDKSPCRGKKALLQDHSPLERLLRERR